MDNIVVGKYDNKNTFVHRLDARLKLLFLFLLMIMIFLPFKLLRYILLATVLLGLLIASKSNMKSLYKLIKPLRFMFLLVLILNLLTMRYGKVWLIAGNFVIYDTPIIQTIYIITRLVMILVVSSILTTTTKPTDLTYAIEYYLKPLKIFKVNTYEIAIMISIALRFIPTLIEETNKITKAQISRGASFQTGSLKERAVAITSLIIPLFVLVFEKAEDLSIAMIVRGYSDNKPRSRYNRFKFGLLEITSLIVFIAIFVIYIVLRKF